MVVVSKTWNIFPIFVMTEAHKKIRPDDEGIGENGKDESQPILFCACFPSGLNLTRLFWLLTLRGKQRRRLKFRLESGYFPTATVYGKQKEESSIRVELTAFISGMSLLQRLLGS